MNTHLVKLLGLLSLALTLAFFSPQQAAADNDDPPGRVARLSYERGSVSFEPGGTDEWVAARVNRPMTTGDKLWTDAEALAEMNTGSAYIRVAANTGISFLNLSDYATQIQLTEGTLLLRVRRLEQNETFEVDTPNLAFSVYQPGNYKITVNQGGDVTVVQVRHGAGEVTGGGAAYSLQEGDEGRFAGTDGLEVEMSSYRYRSDEFENWSSLRDRRIDHSYSSKYVSPDVIGYEDLDQYGGWRSSGEYGNVWFPHTTEVGWAPYHNGHWAYIAPWGYTWVDDEPWGFAPFHYGRWVNVQGAWGWVPGPRESDYGRGEAYVRPVYAPALVAWVGGPHFAVGISVGGGGGYSQGESVGWFPLGPREVYVPSYPVSRTYVNNVNVSNTTVTNTVVNNYYNTTVVNNTNNSTNVNVTNVKYVNQVVPGAVTATTPQAFVSAQPVAKNVVQVNQREIATAPVRIAAPPVAPSKEAVLGTTERASAKPPEAVVNRTVVAKAPPPAPPVPFVQQQKAIEANGGKPVAVSEIRRMRVQEQQQVQRGQQQQQPRAQSGPPAQAPPQVQQTPQQAIRIAPPVQPQNVHPAQAQGNAGNQPAAAPNNQQNQNNRSANQTTQQQPPQPLPQQANSPGQPEKNPSNRPTNPNPQQQQANQSNPNRPNNQPPAARPANIPDPALEQKHQQELEQLHKQQDQGRQRIEQLQLQERKLQEQKAADQLRQQQQQQAQSKAAQQQQQDRKVQEQRIADQQRQQQQQAQSAAQQQQDRKVQEQRIADQQRQQQQQQAQKLQEQKTADLQRQQQQQQAQRAADQQRQQLEQKHQQDLQQLEQKHAQEQQLLNQKHAQEHQQQDRSQPPPPPQRQQQPPPQQKQQQPPPPAAQKDKEKPKKDAPPPPRS